MDENWGIDLTGRKMKFQPWHVDKANNYVRPTEFVIEEIYGIAGEAVNETLLYFEECGGNTEELIKILNEHSFENFNNITRDIFLDLNRYYTNEFYFYLVMFCKLLINDYNWRFNKGEGVQLSEFHKIWEIGFLRYEPFGGKEKDSQYSAHYAIVSSFTDKGFDFSDWYKWAQNLSSKKINISFIEDIRKIEHAWLSTEFWNLLMEFTKIIVNKNNVMTIVEDSFDRYNLQGFSYFPESMLIKPLQYILNKTTNVYDITINISKHNNSAKFLLDRRKTYKIKAVDIYNKSISGNGEKTVLSAYRLIIQKLFKLDKTPIINYVNHIGPGKIEFSIEWEKRILTVPYIQLLILYLSSIIGLLISYFYKFNLFQIFISIIIFGTALIAIFRQYKIAINKKKTAENHIETLIEDSNKRLEKIEKVSEELIQEKQSLEQKVEERTHELAEANIKLQELDKLKSNFFANISHEIRTPLTLILSPVESVLQGDYGDHIDKKFFENLHRNAIRLLKLINNLLDFSKIEAGRMNLKIQEMDVVLYIKNYISSVHSAAESKEITLDFSSLNKETVLFIDIEKFDKIIMNLFSNALKFTEKGGSIKISIRDDDKNCFIEFIDTGIGIPSDKLESIFDRFSQADTDSTRKFEGTGIGLALAKEFVELHDGFIIAKSKYIEDYKNDHGTTFTVTIPKGKEHFQNKENIQFVKSTELEESVTDHRFSGMSELNELRQETEIVKSEFVSNKTKINILVVEDNQDMRNFLNFLLKDLYNVHLAINGEEGLKFAYEIKPDLIVSDVMMPIMNGYEMTKRIKENDEIKRIPVILLTAKAEISNKIEGLEYGADDYLTKPFNSKELLTRIKTHLKNYEYEKIILERNEVMEDELETARLLQQKLLPDRIPEISGYNSHVTYIPMDKVGGDFYDYKENGNIIELFIADVSGHGLPGAFLSMIAKMTLESITTRKSTTSALYIINDIICKSTVKNNYITTFYCLIDKHTNIMRYCNAGHFPPLIYRKKSDEFIELNTKGTALGWFKSMKLEEKEIQLKPGDRLLLYTDGITECMDTKRVEFGNERFKDYIKSNIDLAPEKFTQDLLYLLRKLTGSEAFDDDLCLIVFDVM